MTYHGNQNKLLFWKKTYTSDNRILSSLSHLVLNRFAAIGSQYCVTWLLQPVASITVATWNSFAADILVIARLGFLYFLRDVLCVFMCSSGLLGVLSPITKLMFCVVRLRRNKKTNE